MILSSLLRGRESARPEYTLITHERRSLDLAEPNW